MRQFTFTKNRFSHSDTVQPDLCVRGLDECPMQEPLSDCLVQSFNTQLHKCTFDDIVSFPDEVAWNCWQHFGVIAFAHNFD